MADLPDIDTWYQQAPCGFITLFPDGSIQRINQTLLGWLGYTEAAELINQKFTTLLSKSGMIHYELFLRPMIGMESNVKELNYDLLRKDQSLFPTLVNGAATRDGSGQLAGMELVVFPISERKNYETELRQAKKMAEEESRRFRFLADLNPAIIWTGEPGGMVDYVNQRFFQYLQIPHDSFTSSVILAHIHPGDRLKLLKAWMIALRSGKPLHLDIRLSPSDQSCEWHLVQASPFWGEDGRVIKWFGSCTNIEDHVLALQQKDEFINVASHELKTPVSSLKASLQLLDRIKDNPQSAVLPQLIAQANKNVNKIIMLINDLLNVSQMTGGQLQLNKSSFNVRDMLQEWLTPIMQNVTHSVEIEGGADIEIWADPVRIEQVVINFVTNAIKYAPGSSVIRVAITVEGDAVKIAVKDNGPGIPRDKLPRLFDRYYQVNPSGKNYSGLGLGLYISAQIIQKHEGQIGVDSELGKGSIFWFTLARAT